MERISSEKVLAKFDAKAVLDGVGVAAGSDRERELRALVDEARELARPGALYLPVNIDDRGDDYIKCGAVTLQSRVLAVNVENVHRVFPYVATSGGQLEQWAKDKSDAGHGAWANAIAGSVLVATMVALEQEVKTRYALNSICRMNPGSIEDWPLTEQSALFELIGDASPVGVVLKDDMFMTPALSVSGLWFASESNFESCMLCPRDGCPGRRAEYDDALYQQKYES